MKPGSAARIAASASVAGVDVFMLLQAARRRPRETTTAIFLITSSFEGRIITFGGKIRAMRKTLWLLAFLTASSAFARGSTPKELLISLKFKPQEGVHSSSANLPPAMVDKSVDIRVKDGRRETDSKVIGQGTGGDDKTFPIRVGDTIQPFIKETLTDVAKNW